jgi:hypothetical protein
MSTEPPKRLKFIGCKVFHREACLLAAKSPHSVEVEFLDKGLHDLQTADMAAKIQEAVDAADASEQYDAVLLGYARCNDGLVGVTARRIPLVIPRAHDCITLYFGSRKAYRKYFDEHPGTYYLTTGWMEHNPSADGSLAKPAYGMEGAMAKLGLAETYEEMLAKYGKDNADYILETLGGWAKAYDTLCYIEMGVCDEEPFIERGKRRAEQRGWRFERRRGDLFLLRRLLFGDWDDDFVIVRPGGRIVSRNDESVLDVEKQ